MNVREYNNKFLPRIDHAKEFIMLFESAIQHMDSAIVDKQEVMRHFELRGWSKETKQTILQALSCYKKQRVSKKLNTTVIGGKCNGNAILSRI